MPLDAVPQMRVGDQDAPRGESLPVVVVLDTLRSAYNTGNIFRLADAVNARAHPTRNWPRPPWAATPWCLAGISPARRTPSGS